MNRVIMLDTGVLAMVTHPSVSPEIEACNQWVEELLNKDEIIAVPEIADYELRRELLRADKS